MKKLILLSTLIVFITACHKGSDDPWYGPVIPVSVKGIETVNIDNSGEFPVVTSSPVKKEAYMIGIKWITDNIPTVDDKYITDPVWGYGYKYPTRYYKKAIVCLTQFNADIPAGTYVSKYFKDVYYLPEDVDEGFVLLVAPDPGEHSFRVEYWYEEQLEFSYETEPIEFF